MHSLTAALPVLVLCGAVVVGRGTLRDGVARFPVATLVSVVVVAVPSAVQLLVAPSLLQVLQRDWPRILDGQWWRLLTALVVQDGGPAGTLLNLVGLAVVGFFAERTWGRMPFVLIALVAGVGAQFWGAVVQPVGAGNSVAVFGLAASLAVANVRGPSVPLRVVSAVTLTGGVVLLVLGDLHGGAFALGAVCAVVLLVRRGRAGRTGRTPARRAR